MGEGWHVHVRDILVDKGWYFLQSVGMATIAISRVKGTGASACYGDHRPRPDWRCGSLRCALAEGHCSLVAAVVAAIVVIVDPRPFDADAVAALHWLAETACTFHSLYFTARGVAHVTLCRDKQH